MRNTRFVLIRHGQSIWNAIGRWQGHGDPPLSDRGRSQAAECAQHLRGLAVDRLVCSDLLRARETAETIGNILGLDAVANPRLRELAVGRWTGLTHQEIAARESELLARFESGDPEVRPGGGETRNEIRARVRAEVEVLARAHPGGRIVLVVHAGVIRALVPEANPDHLDVIHVTLEEIRAAVHPLPGAETNAGV